MQRLATSRKVVRLKEAGFLLGSARGLSLQVRRTWRVCIGRLALKLVTDGRYRRFLRDNRRENRRFVLALPRLYLAYGTGAMRYGFFTARKPAGGNPVRMHVV